MKKIYFLYFVIHAHFAFSQEGSSNVKPLVQSVATAEHYEWGNHCDGWHLLKDTSLSVIQERMPPGTSEQLHYHTKAQQVFYILSGTAQFEVGDDILEVKAGQSLHIPKGTKHRIFNKSKETITLLVISQPKAQGDRINLD